MGRCRAHHLRVYPRTHGETAIFVFLPQIPYGLSPYTRGNLLKKHRDFKGKGSIPVHTGKPASSFASMINIGVYPRTHGETIVATTKIYSDMGLSPYTRGNPRRHLRMYIQNGSIPVHTGKPTFFASIPVHSEVYPRTHGETFRLRSFSRSASGLSPYTRGNQQIFACAIGCFGSIPVHTGKPYPLSGIDWQGRVYPRTHGETIQTLMQKPASAGLSPYTRGNLARFSQAACQSRSIPVHTGKPVQTYTSSYPVNRRGICGLFL